MRVGGHIRAVGASVVQQPCDKRPRRGPSPGFPGFQKGRNQPVRLAASRDHLIWHGHRAE
jgi:hypothetical protein